MDDHREPPEDLDRWLHERIDPLPPPPGTFDLIRRRVRHRRYRQVAVSAAVAAAVAAAVVVVPRVATSVLNVNPNPTSNSAASARSATPSAPAQGPNKTPGGTSESNAASPAPINPLVPANFDATSATFIGLHTGWVIGQAGTPGHCSTQYCTSVARTTNAGQTWTGVPAPLTGAPDGASGVGQIRFLTGSDGWAFGPQLFATADGGQHWTQEGTNGQRVTDLETVGNRAYAIWATCTGTGADFAASCTSFSLYSTVAGQDAWAPVPGATGLTASGAASSASLVLTSSQGFLLAPNGSVYTGPVDGSGSWQQVSAGPYSNGGCAAGPAQASGQPTGALLAAASPTSLVLICRQLGASSTTTRLFASSDGGRTWENAGPALGYKVTGAAAQPDGLVVLATTDGIVVLHNITAQREGTFEYPPQTALAGGFSWVGMTSDSQGVAISADPSQHEVWFTFDGGQSWRPSVISKP